MLSTSNVHQPPAPWNGYLDPDHVGLHNSQPLKPVKVNFQPSPNPPPAVPLPQVSPLAEYDPVAPFHPPVSAPYYSHDIYSTLSTKVSILPASPVSSANTSRRSPFSSAPASDIFTQANPFELKREARNRERFSTTESQPIDAEELMRSYVQRGRFVIPDPFYEVDEKAYLEYQDRRRGTFVVIIASKGRWNKDKQDIEYELKLGDGRPYDNGAWVEEKRLKDSS